MNPPERASFSADSFDPLVEDGIRRGAYPGAALVVGRRDAILFAKGYGHLTWSASSPAVDPDSTMYDLASLTKVIATTTAVMLLVERGQVRLEEPVAAYIAELKGPETAAITVRQLLTHTSGLRADIPDRELKAIPDSAALMARVLRETPRVPPGTRIIYSDLNAILLGEV
ncbi:MAG TPA: serine hydrolase domain-containing protein, partial [Gemmatimonadales bacterium]|nr:serine hydrolase domain-containing protein [Gemmatimonadales bacterium]